MLARVWLESSSSGFFSAHVEDFAVEDRPASVVSPFSLVPDIAGVRHGTYSTVQPSRLVATTLAGQVAMLASS